jgi:outer membrane protein OmpA-like peptidoglycan-associated protein
MFNRLSVVAIGVVAVIAAGAAAQRPSTDPDSPAVAAAARAALANARILDIVGVSSDIVGLSGGIVGVSRGLDSVMKDLGAKVTAQEIKIELSADVLFDFDKFDLKAQATDSLMKVATVIKAYPKAPLLIEGHTDGKGAHAYNVSLSEKRAAAVKAWLVQNAGVDPARIATSGWGETKPVAPNTLPSGADNPEGRQKNRRVDITLRTL